MPNETDPATKKRAAAEKQPNEERPAKKKSRKKKHQDPAAAALRQTIQMSCRDNDLPRALRAYDQAVSDGTKVDAFLYYHLLALCGGLQEQHGSRIHVGRPRESSKDEQPGGPSETNQPETAGIDKKDVIEEHEAKDSESPAEKDDTPQLDTTTTTTKADEPSKEGNKEVPLEDRVRHAFRIKAAMDDAKIPLTEAAYTSVIKLLSKSGDLEQANTLLLESEKVQQCNPKLRLYSSLLQAYAEANKPIDAVRIWYLLTQQKLLVTEKEYLALIRCAIAMQSPTLMESVLTDLAEDVPVPSRDTVEAIITWFSSPVAIKTTEEVTNETDLSHMLRKVHTPLDNSMRMVSPCMGPVQTTTTTGWTISRDCTIDGSTGKLTSGCLEGESLQPIEIAPETWQDMVKANETIVLSGQLQQHKSEFQGGGKGSKKLPNDKKERERHWHFFRRYLDQRPTPIDVVIDGANIGYAEQNFDGAPRHVSYEQIDWVIDAFRAQGKSVLVVMHHRHFTRHQMPRKYEPLMNKWIRQDLLYRTPPGMNDDWFWMHVALAKPGTLVVTNDEMRDHHFQMLAPRSFLRWKDRHQVHFEFGSHEPRNGRDGPRRRAVTFRYPDPYSRRIQRVADGLVVPLPKRGDENRFLDGCFVAEDDTPDSETYGCIRPKP